MPAALEGRVALVVGASQGMGAAAARAFAEHGATVVLAARSADRLRLLAEQLKAEGHRALAVPTDLADPGSAEAMVKEVMSTYGRLDAAFNVAGVMPASSALLADLSVEDFDRVVGVNLRGIFLAMKYEIRAMLAGGGGAVVNTSSVAGLVGNTAVSAYNASKHGVIGLTKAAALEYATRGIRVNAIAPGNTMTEMLAGWTRADPAIRARLTAAQPMRRIADPIEAVLPAVWLCSDAASYVTGATLSVDGGYTAQ